MIIIDLIYNLSLLVALSVISGFVDSRYDRNKLPGKIIQGMLFGIVAVIGMIYPFVLAEGIIFDGRSIVISLCTLFFGPISGLISSIIAVAFRLYLGGDGILTGILVISASFLIGFLYFHLKASGKFKQTNLGLYLFGLLVSAVMMGLMLTLPSEVLIQTYKIISITVLLFFPLITLLIGKILLDQEENKNYLTRINQEKKLYLTTIYSIGDGVVTTDVNGIIKQLNPVAEKLTGWSENESKQKKLTEIFKIINEETRELIENPVEQVLNYGTVVGLTNHTLLVSRDGKEIPISSNAAPIKSEDGIITGVVLVFSDKTKEHEKEMKIREIVQKYNNLFNSIRDAIIVADLNRKIIQCNPAFIDLFGYQFDELKEKETSIIYENQNEFLIMGKKTEENIDNPNFVHTVKYKKKNGTVFPGETNVFYLNDGQGKIIGFIGLIRNVTDRKKTEVQLNEKIIQLEKFNKAMVGREIKMIELKKEINELSSKLNLPAKYKISSEIE